MYTYYLDAAALMDALKAGLGNWRPGDPRPSNWSRFLDDLLDLNGRVVTNSYIYKELTAYAFPDAQLAKEWMDQHKGAGFDYHELTDAEMAHYSQQTNPGERSLVETTMNHLLYGADPTASKLVTSDGKIVAEDFFRNSPLTTDNLTDIRNIYQERWSGSMLDSRIPGTQSNSGDTIPN